ncbi:MAG TPA: HAD-IA family hydrolase, partial [Kribbellaceae bacterium]
GTPWAIVSSGSRWFVQRCFAAASLPLPAVRVFGEDVRRGKPAPDGYLRAARRLAVHPADCVVVEDTPDGVRAGTSAGCTVIAVATTHAPVRLRDADRCLPTLSAVADLLPTLVLNGDQ